MNQKDTIAAIATPPGRGGIGIIRISGPLVTLVANTLLGKLPQPRQAEYLPFLYESNVAIDQGIALFFPNPHSFTGEDVLELQCHGGPVILDLLLQYIAKMPGVRIAHPGEFSERAFLNEKLDLTQAEAIADLIDASSIQAVRSATNSLQGAFSYRIHELVEALTNLRIYIEADIDFHDEKIDLLSEEEIETSLSDIIAKLDRVRIEARHGSLLREGIKVVIAGKPNVGKSSLINALAGREVAIVTDIAGTTRDVLREYIHIDGIPLHIIDTAGLRDTNEEVERVGIERAWREIEQADHVLLMVDDTTITCNYPDTIWLSLIERLPSRVPITVVRNKIDLTGERASVSEFGGYSLITLSAQFNVGVDLLRAHLKESIGFTDNNTEGVFLARRRHLDALGIAANHLQEGRELIMSAHCHVELLAEELRLAQQYLSEITGKFSSDNLLSKIFSNFCIGK